MQFLKDKTTVKLTAVILALGIMVSGMAVINLSGLYTKVDAANVSDATVKKYKDQLAAVEAERNASKLALQEARKNTQDEMANKAALDAVVTFTQKKIDIQNEKLTAIEEQIADTEIKITQIEDDIITREELFKERLVAAHEEGNVSYLEIILGSENLIDFFRRVDTVSTMLEYDKTLIQQSEKDKIALEENRILLEERQKEIESTKSDIEITKKELEAAQEESANFIIKLQADEERAAAIEAIANQKFAEADSQLNKAISDYNKKLADQKAAEEAARKAAELSAKTTQSSLSSYSSQTTQYVTASGGYMWPISSTTITSKFGYRKLGGVGENHGALDISAPYGTAVYASNAGTVLVAEYHYSYGNYILVDHGDGNSTLYAHLSSIGVSVNQSVSKGSTIGKVGSTGYSTGNHLHFEFRVSGTKVDPLKYVSP